MPYPEAIRDKSGWRVVVKTRPRSIISEDLSATIAYQESEVPNTSIESGDELIGLLSDLDGQFEEIDDDIQLQHLENENKVNIEDESSDGDDSEELDWEDNNDNEEDDSDEWDDDNDEDMHYERNADKDDGSSDDDAIMEKVRQNVTNGRKSKRAKVAANTSVLDPPPPTAAHEDVPIGVRDKWFERFQDTYSWLSEDTVEAQFMANLSETQSSKSPSGEEGASQQNNSAIDELKLWVDIVGGKKKGRVFGLGGAAKMVGNGFCGGSLPKSSFWEKKFEDKVKKTEVMEKQLMVATTRLDEMKKFIRAMQFSLGFEPQNGGTEATESDSTDESSSEDESSEDDEI
ncbi:hypothetical protein Tsubulata_001352 [Turnera subulata]|uniref:Uncharacterized protein n=1 Tax=Turnera subulata TaxID=218843 RepID=A0A9Q0FJG6_9ROSI|nr:hypothetical protein Tsubulata_001352 [Turnera subulata]